MLVFCFDVFYDFGFHGSYGFYEGFYIISDRKNSLSFFQEMNQKLNFLT